MLSNDDLQQVKNIVNEAVSTVNESTREILEVMRHYAGEVDKRFEGIDQKFVSIDERFDSMDKRFDRIDERFESMDKRFDRIEATMVTKSYLDDKIADLRGELVLLARKEDTKLVTLVQSLKKTKVLPQNEAVKILAMEPFPRK